MPDGTYPHSKDEWELAIQLEDIEWEMEMEAEEELARVGKVLTQFKRGLITNKEAAYKILGRG